MEETKQLTDKELIAEFMGIDWENATFQWRPGASRNMTIEDLDNYRTNWSWLMPVVEKINSLRGWNFTISWDGSVVYDDNFKYTAQGKVFSSKGGLDIQSVYSAAIQFIKWYSNQPHKA